MPSPEVIEVLLVGYIPSKKNTLERRAGRGRGMRYKDAARVAIDALTAQVPAAYRNLKLVHPRVSWQFTMPVRRQDRDNMKTTVLDILKKTGVIQDDNLAHYNGLEVMHPAVIDPSQEPSVLVRLRPARVVEKKGRKAAA